jgi:8-oxo-dGTP pyrophosphatase MutT (NUDIX family)
VREDEVTRPDGQPGLYGVVEVRAPAVFVVPVTDAGEVVLVEVDRYATGGRSWEVPAGGSDGQDLFVAAQRELLEETGLVAGELTALARVQSLNGVADAPGQVFLASRYKKATLDRRRRGDTRVSRFREPTSGKFSHPRRRGCPVSSRPDG